MQQTLTGIVAAAPLRQARHGQSVLWCSLRDERGTHRIQLRGELLATGETLRPGARVRVGGSWKKAHAETSGTGEPPWFLLVDALEVLAQSQPATSSEPAPGADPSRPAYKGFKSHRR